MINSFFDPETIVEPLPDWISIIDLNYRSVIANDPETQDQSIFDRQLETLLKPEFWAPCNSCSIRDQCFIKYNVDTFSDPNSGLAVRERLKTLFEVVHLRRKLHITMRDMRSALSWMFFRDQTCDDVANIVSNQTDPKTLLSLLYHNAFAADGKPLEGHLDDRLVLLLRQIDPAETANALFDRELFFRNLSEQNLSTFEARSTLESTWLEEWKLDNGWEAAQDPTLLEQHQRRHAMLRRIAYFERRDDGWISMLPYQQLRTFQEITWNEQVSSSEEIIELKRAIVKGISIAEGARNSSLTDSNICLRTSQTEKVRAKSFRLFPAADFDIRLPTVPSSGYLEYVPDQIVFYHNPEDPEQKLPSAKTAELFITIDLLELLLQISEGYSPSPNDKSGVFVNLTIFKNALAHLPYKHVVLTRDDKQFYELSLETTNSIRLQRIQTGVDW